MNNIQQKLVALVGSILFGGTAVKVEKENMKKLLSEAQSQAVLTTVFPYLQEEFKKSLPEEYAEIRSEYLGSIYRNTSNFAEHAELHGIMQEQKIPYVVLKGFAAAYYYPAPELREMGDVDFLVYQKDFGRAQKAVEGAGFMLKNDNEDGIHIAFKRPPLSVWEQHREINGIPDGDEGRHVRAELEDVIEKARLVRKENTVCLIPGEFHHGLILLLHMAVHLKHEGIGLRHLCDWAVFVNSIKNEQFKAEFEAKLKALGLWKFAQTMTLIGIKYLGTDDREWAHNSEINDAQLDEVLTDILDGGNFGTKDFNRYREIKYISGRGANAVQKGSIFTQLIKAVNRKVYDNHSIIKNHRVLLPAGWIIEGGKYAGLLLSGKRKRTGTADMLKEAAKRKDIYSRLELFKPE